LSAAPGARKATPAVAFCFLVNRLLERETWARERLAAFAGRVIAVRVPLLPDLVLLINHEGKAEEAAAAPDVVVSAAGLSGDSALADELRLLARDLRWDFEEEFSRVVGDVPAHAIGAAIRRFAHWQLDLARRLADGVADYGGNEARLLVRRSELESHALELTHLLGALDALEERLARLD